MLLVSFLIRYVCKHACMCVSLCFDVCVYMQVRCLSYQAEWVRKRKKEGRGRGRGRETNLFFNVTLVAFILKLNRTQHRLPPINTTIWHPYSQPSNQPITWPPDSQTSQVWLRTKLACYDFSGYVPSPHLSQSEGIHSTRIRYALLHLCK